MKCGLFHQIEHRFTLPVTNFNNQQPALAKRGISLRHDGTVRLQSVFPAVKRKVRVVSLNLRFELANLRGRDIGRVADDSVESCTADCAHPIST